MKQWIEYMQQVSGYAVQSDWYLFLQIGKKQGKIYVQDANNLIHILGFKPYEANHKIAIIWLADKMDASPANKLLKTFEEPPDDTLIFLIAERYELLLPTVRSRAQLIKVPRLKDDEIRQALSEKYSELPNIDQVVANASGDWSKAVQLLQQTQEDDHHFENFREWLLLCYKFDYPAIFKFSQKLAALGREKQKSFLQYGLQVVHNSLQVNSNNSHLVRGSNDEKKFFNSFAKYINRSNRDDFYTALNEAIYHIERNAHAGILFGDLSLTLVVLLNRGRKAISA